MNKVIVVNKPLGITSYDVIRRLKKVYKGEKIGHAGTLDPLADGVLIVLIGKDANARQSEFMNVNKEYVFTVLLGFETDTYDILGLIQKVGKYNKDISGVDQEFLNQFKGVLQQKVPPFSAVKVKGKPLYRWYLSGEIDKVDIPTKEVKVEEIELLDDWLINGADLESQILDLLEKVKAGFRQKEIMTKWNKVMGGKDLQKFRILKIRAVVSKGTYVRAIANDIGQKLGCGACTINITRTRVGEYNLSQLPADEL